MEESREGGGGREDELGGEGGEDAANRKSSVPDDDCHQEEEEDANFQDGEEVKHELELHENLDEELGKDEDVIQEAPQGEELQPAEKDRSQAQKQAQQGQERQDEQLAQKSTREKSSAERLQDQEQVEDQTAASPSARGKERVGEERVEKEKVKDPCKNFEIRVERIASLRGSSTSSTSGSVFSAISKTRLSKDACRRSSFLRRRRSNLYAKYPNLILKCPWCVGKFTQLVHLKTHAESFHGAGKFNYAKNRALDRRSMS